MSTINILGGQLTMSVDLRTGGTQATHLISNVHQPYSVGTDELYSKREGYKPMGRQSLISIPLFPLPPPSLSSSAPVFSLIYFQSKHIFHRATPHQRRGVALHLTYHWVSWVSEHLSPGELVSGHLMPGE